MAISAPFTTSTAVAFLYTTSLKGGTDFTSQTVPTKTAVDEIISWISSQVELQFQMAGYVLPFVDLEGEAWPDSQTKYLKLVTTFGAVAMAGGFSLKPAPALSPGQQGGSGNIYQDLFTAELEKIYNFQTNRTILRFRAGYYPSTPAENAIVAPSGPTTDFMEGYTDPMRFLPMYDVANRVLAIERTLRDRVTNWDYLYGLFGLNKGIGTSIYEIGL